MASSLTIHAINDELAAALRTRAARHRRSVEDEVLHILQEVWQSDAAPPQQDLACRIANRVAALGGVDLTIAPREAAREPPQRGVLATQRKPAPDIE